MIKTIGGKIRFSAWASFILEKMKQYPNSRIFESSGLLHKKRLAYELAEVKESSLHGYNYLCTNGYRHIDKQAVWFLMSQGLLDETIIWRKSKSPRKCWKLNEQRANLLEKQ